MKPVVPLTVPYPDMRSRQELGVKLWGQRSRPLYGHHPFAKESLRSGGWFGCILIFGPFSGCHTPGLDGMRR
jgi:hypothetical protein